MPETAAPLDAGSTIVPLPSLGADMDVGTVIEWMVSVGDRVERGDVIAVVSTEKSDIDVESWESGWVARLIAPLDQELPVGEPLLVLQQDQPSGDQIAPEPPDDVAPPPAQDEASTPDPVSPPTIPTPKPSAPTARQIPRATPRARRLAAQRGVDLADIVGSGPAGAIVSDDIAEAATVEPVPEAELKAAPDTAEPASPVDPMRRAIAERMSRANREIPHYHLERDIDLTVALDWLETRNADLPITERIVPAALLACAVARAAAAVPACNGTWSDDHFEPGAAVDLGLVVSLRRGGLLAPTIASADAVGLDAMMAEIKAMVGAARSGQLRSRWMRPASITLTNLGDLGADRVAGIIFPPQVAIVGFGRIVERPWVVDGVVTARSVVAATLSADHRASDGADGSRFLASLAKVLSAPETLVG